MLQLKSAHNKDDREWFAGMVNGIEQIIAIEESYTNGPNANSNK